MNIIYICIFIGLVIITEKKTIMGLKEVIGVVEALGIKELNHTNNHTGTVLL